MELMRIYAELYSTKLANITIAKLKCRFEKYRDKSKLSALTKTNQWAAISQKQLIGDKLSQV
jgi:hypothetical protein